MYSLNFATLEPATNLQTLANTPYEQRIRAESKRLDASALDFRSKFKAFTIMLDCGGFFRVRALGRAGRRGWRKGQECLHPRPRVTNELLQIFEVGQFFLDALPVERPRYLGVSLVVDQKVSVATYTNENISLTR